MLMYVFIYRRVTTEVGKFSGPVELLPRCDSGTNSVGLLMYGKAESPIVMPAVRCRGGKVVGFVRRVPTHLFDRAYDVAITVEPSFVKESGARMRDAVLFYTLLYATVEEVCWCREKREPLLRYDFTTPYKIMLRALRLVRRRRRDAIKVLPVLPEALHDFIKNFSNVKAYVNVYWDIVEVVAMTPFHMESYVFVESGDGKMVVFVVPTELLDKAYRAAKRFVEYKSYGESVGVGEGLRALLG